MICLICGYEWEPRVENPKACPMCKRYIVKAVKKVSGKVRVNGEWVDDVEEPVLSIEEQWKKMKKERAERDDKRNVER